MVDENPGKFAVVVPCYNDWQCLRKLIQEFKELPQTISVERFLIVNDGSTEQSPIEDEFLQTIGFRIETLNLKTNMGHQFAIAAGIQSLLISGWKGTIVVMDSDGEDDPASLENIQTLVARYPNNVIVARRGKRFNSFTFKLFYAAYRIGFRYLTGKSINFGNFMAIPNVQAKRLISIDDTWNHLAGSVLKHCVEIKMITVNRRNRFFGKSKMNFISLISHGLGGLAVFAEVIFIRMIFAALLVLSLCLTVSSLVLYLKFFTNSSIPGWTTSVLGFTLLLAFQTVAILFTTTISLLLAKKKLQPPNYILANQFIVE
jgi:glycosyltransferase involved in cell wall biosynthesis